MIEYLTFPPTKTRRRGAIGAFAAALVILISVCASAQPVSPVEVTKVVAITNVTLVDVIRGHSSPGITVVWDEGSITNVGPRTPVPRGAGRVDGTGLFLIPGLWDMHTHHQATGVESLPLFLANGVVGTRDMGSDLDFILPLRASVNSGGVLGPRIVAAGPILDDAPPSYPWRVRVRSAAEATATVAALKAAGVDFIKVHDHTPRDAYFAIVAEARRNGLPVAGHVPAAVTVEEAAHAGQKSIEHLANFRLFLECSGQQAYVPSCCEPLYSVLAQSGVWQTPTLAFYLTAADLFSGTAPPAVEYASSGLRKLWQENAAASQLSAEALGWLRNTGATALKAISDMLAIKVQFLAGCDGLVPGFCLHDELEWMVRAGMSPAEALRTATINPAMSLERDRSEGSIEAGKAASMVLLEGNPLIDIRNTRRISAVVVEGRLLSRPVLDAMLAEARRRFASEAKTQDR